MYYIFFLFVFLIMLTLFPVGGPVHIFLNIHDIHFYILVSSSVSFNPQIDE